MHSHDVIIIGSGPAGCSATMACHHAGLSIAMVTNAKHHDAYAGPGPLESIHPGVMSFLEKIQLDAAARKATVASYSGIYHNKVHTSFGHDEAGPWQGLHINRSVFDLKLLELILALPIEVIQGEKAEDIIVENEKVVGIRTKSKELFATYIIDASGKSGIGGKKLNFKRSFFSPPLLCWTGISGDFTSYELDSAAAHFFPKENGWTWIAPLPPHHCAWTRLTSLDEKSFEPPVEIKDHPVIGEVKVANMRWRLYRPLVKEGIVLCGDAAGILDPAAGQGILNSLLSGHAAGDTIVKCLNHPELASFYLAHYDDWFVQQFERKVEQLKEYYEMQGIQW